MKRNKKHSLQERTRFVTAILFLLIFLPILCTILLSGKESFQLSREREMEQLLATVTYKEIPDEVHMDMVCAQAVLVRSRIWLECEKAENEKEVYNKILGENVEYERSHKINKEKMMRCKEAVDETKGCMLSYGGQVVEGPFCRASNGWTRGGKEVFGKDSYGWLVGVKSKKDLDYKSDRRPVVFTEDELYEKITGRSEIENLDAGALKEGLGQLNKEGLLDSFSIITEDSSGYAMEIEIGGIRMSGEAFRQALDLPSASFTFSKEGEEILFTCRGTGHGMGMSQYGAEAMAKEGKDWREILNYYFPNAQIIKKGKTEAADTSVSLFF